MEITIKTVRLAVKVFPNGSIDRHAFDVYYGDTRIGEIVHQSQGWAGYVVNPNTGLAIIQRINTEHTMIDCLSGLVEEVRRRRERGLVSGRSQE